MGPSPTLSRLSLLFRLIAKRLPLQPMALTEMLLPTRPLSRHQKASVEVSHSCAIYTSVSASMYRFWRLKNDIVRSAAYTQWSVFTALTPTLFYFSVWELGIAGSELSLLSTLSPIVLGIPIVRDILSSRIGRTTLHVLTLAGLLAYLLKSPLYRLFAVAFANAVLCIGWTIDWSAPPVTIGYQSLGTLRHL